MATHLGYTACWQGLLVNGNTSEESLRVGTQDLAKAISTYKQDSKTAKGLETSSKPKKAKAKKGQEKEDQK